MSEKKVLVIAIYSHPEYLPPTLNAIEYLSEIYEKIYVVHRNVEGFDWQYPSNVKLLYAGALLTVRAAEQKSIIAKIKAFLAFSILLANTYRSNKASALLLYDFMPILSYRIIHKFIRAPQLLWYHNHDVAEQQYLRKWSLSWLAWKSEKWIFPKLTIFSLPAMERKDHFFMEKLKGAFYFIPNYPSSRKYTAINKSKSDDSVFRILFQGSIGTGHGLEEIISILNQPVGGKILNLVVKGFISKEYKSQLEQLAKQNNVLDKLIFMGPSGYREVIANAQNCHIGIGIHRKTDVMNKTLGTASNKIYEYAAAGLPVLIYDNIHFRKHLQQYEWAFFTDGTPDSIKTCIEKICTDYTKYCNKARDDFEANLNFEVYFEPVCSFLKTF